METKSRPGAAAREETALHMFRQMDLRGQTQNDTQLKTVHQNTISTIRLYEENGGVVRKYSSMLIYPSIFYVKLTHLTLFCSQWG